MKAGLYRDPISDNVYIVVVYKSGDTHYRVAATEPWLHNQWVRKEHVDFNPTLPFKSKKTRTVAFLRSSPEGGQYEIRKNSLGTLECTCPRYQHQLANTIDQCKHLKYYLGMGTEWLPFWATNKKEHTG